MNRRELQSLDEALIYLNETLEDARKGGPYGKHELKKLVRNLLKKKKKDDKHKYSKKEEKKIVQLTPEEKKQLENEYNEDYDELLKTLKLCLSKLKAEKDFKKKCIESSRKINKYFSENDPDRLKDGYIPNLVIEDDGDCYILIIDDWQLVAIEYNWVLHDLVDILDADYKEVSDKWDFGYGDGDEGCLYPSYMGR